MDGNPMTPSRKYARGLEEIRQSFPSRKSHVCWRRKYRGGATEDSRRSGGQDLNKANTRHCTHSIGSQWKRHEKHSLAPDDLRLGKCKVMKRQRETKWTRRSWPTGTC